MAERYRKVDVRFWRDEEVQRLSPTDKLLAVYILTSPQSNRIGCHDFSAALAAEDLGLPPETVRSGLQRLCEQLGWQFDCENRVLYLPKWWKYHGSTKVKGKEGQCRELPPQNLLSMIADVYELPASQLVEHFLDNADYLSKSPRQLLAEADQISQVMRERGRKGGKKRSANQSQAGVVAGVVENPSTQEQEQEQEQKQEQEQERASSSKPDEAWLIPEKLDTPEVRSLLSEFEHMRKAIRRPITSRARQSANLKHFDNVEHLVYALETCIANEYQGLKPDYRPPKQVGQSKSDRAMQAGQRALDRLRAGEASSQARSLN